MAPLRQLTFLAVALLALAGCSQPGPTAAPALDPEVPLEVDEWGGASSVLLVEGRVPWRDEAPQDLALETAFQTVFGICQWPGGHTPDVSQFHLSGRLPHGPLPNGTGSFRVKADWSDADHLATALRFVAITPDGEASILDFLPRGKTVDIPLTPRVPAQGAWDLWLCTVGQANPSGTPATQTAFPFVGAVGVRVELLPAQGQP